MIEYRIEMKSDLKFIKKLWKEFFQNDEKWHFTLEGDYMEVRVSKPIQKLTKWLKDKKITFTVFTYLDNIPITRKYQKQFEKIFHGLSELSMLVSRKGNLIDESYELQRILERNIHLSFNILGFNGYDEMCYMSKLLIDRCYFYGHYCAEQEQKDIGKKKEIIWKALK